MSLHMLLWFNQRNNNKQKKLLKLRLMTYTPKRVPHWETIQIRLFVTNNESNSIIHISKKHGKSNFTHIYSWHPIHQICVKQVFGYFKWKFYSEKTKQTKNEQVKRNENRLTSICYCKAFLLRLFVIWCAKWTRLYPFFSSTFYVSLKSKQRLNQSIYGINKPQVEWRRIKMYEMNGILLLLLLLWQMMLMGVAEYLIVNF